MLLLLALCAALPPDPDALPASLAGELPQERRPVDIDAPRTTQIAVNAALHGRFSVPFGYAERDVVVYGNVVIVDGDLGWSDVFDSGWGASLTVDLRKARAHGSGRIAGHYELGGYVSYQLQHYGGRTARGDSGGVLKSDDLRADAVLAGIKVTQPIAQGFFSDGRFGIGVVHYSEVQGTFSAPTLPAVRETLFDETWTFAAELVGHLGARVGPAAFTVGLGLDFWMPPNEGDVVYLDSGPLWGFFIELGIELGF